MASRRAPTMTREGWLRLARSRIVRGRIASDHSQEDYQAMVRFVAGLRTLDWCMTVALLNMVYGWMPTKLEIEAHTPEEQAELVKAVSRAKLGSILVREELARIQRAANGSIVGASKLLHVLRPDHYPIWDSRVAGAFLWRGVSPATYSTLARYIDYVTAVWEWGAYAEVRRECAALRKLRPALHDASDMRMVELVLFRRYR